jgi:hypothetical protein
MLTGKYRPKDKKVPLSYAAVRYFGYLITKDREDSKSFLRRLLSKLREIDKNK